MYLITHWRRPRTTETSSLLKASMSRCLLSSSSSWLRLAALVCCCYALIPSSSAFILFRSNFKNSCNFVFRGNQLNTHHGLSRPSSTIARQGIADVERLPRAYFGWRVGRRPRPKAISAPRMVELYRDEAEADFYADRLQDLITVYAMKTAHHYWLELRGNMYAEWLARYIEEQGGVESVGWEKFLSGMLRAPPEDIVVKKLIKSPQGGSGNNPYLKDRKPVTYTETIEPVSIARRIMEIREQVAELLSSDLNQISAENIKLQQDYVAESEFGPASAQSLRLSEFEPMREVDASSGLANPPQRRSTYRSALELVTSASIRRVKSELRIRGDRHTLDWLERLSEVELEQRGNKLIQAIFAGTMVLINDPDRARPKIIEPLKVAQIIMQGREIVAEELIAVLAKVPADHNKLTVSLLNEKWHSVGDLEAGAPDPSER